MKWRILEAVAVAALSSAAAAVIDVLVRRALEPAPDPDEIGPGATWLALLSLHH